MADISSGTGPHVVFSGRRTGIFTSDSLAPVHNRHTRDISADIARDCKNILRRSLQAGYIDKRVLFATPARTPQRVIVSPVIANMALDGLEAAAYASVGSSKLSRSNAQLNVIRHADDFIVTGVSNTVLEFVHLTSRHSIRSPSVGLSRRFLESTHRPLLAYFKRLSSVALAV
ncbi:hypothetical protein [Allopusillimonas ginsengisoli]|uniref:hypothetical protein n=1 Tax=Allopusillimonas ginsengisoli TaxID=453575 RepID=UPI001FD64AB2|nr:hypothetical protein [Allopusillimonas ginsengisoli]